MTLGRSLIGDIQSADVSAIMKVVSESTDSGRLAWEVVHDAINANREAVIEALIPMLSSNDRVFALALAAEEGLANVVRKLVPLTEPRAKTRWRWCVQLGQGTKRSWSYCCPLVTH